MQSNNSVHINITVMTVVKIILVFLLFYFLYLVKDVLAILFVSLILASSIDPWVDKLQKKKIPRGVSVMLIYITAFGVFFSSMYLIIPPIINEITNLANNFPVIEQFKEYLTEKMVFFFSLFRELSLSNALIYIKNNVGGLSSVGGAAGGVFSTVSGLFSWVFTFLLTLVITFYMVVEENAIKKIIWSIAPEKYQVYTMHLVNRMQQKIGLWLRGQLILSVIMFVFAYVGLLILGVDYALVLALVTGITEFVPYLGPIFAAIPAMFLAFTQGGVMLMVSVGVFYYAIQLVENNIIVPKLMQKVVGLNPIVSISVLMIGLKVGGAIGMILSIPVATAVSVFVKDLFEHKMIEN